MVILNFTKNIRFIIKFFILFSLISSPAFCPKGDFGAVFSDSLNFTYKTIKTGPNGTVKTIDGKSFDIEDIHRQLSRAGDDVGEATGSKHNVVVAGLTILVNIAGSIEVFYQPLREGQETLAFVSGDIPRGYKKDKYKIIGASKEYPPMVLLTNFGQRVALRGNQTRTDIERLKRYNQEWVDAQRKSVEQLQAVVSKASRQQFESVFAFTSHLKELSDKSEQEANSSFGSSIDSEQYLLAYLNTNRRTLNGPSITNMSFRFRDLLVNYKAEKMLALRKSLSADLAKASTDSAVDTNKMLRDVEVFTKRLKSYNESSVAGYIFHLHTTNEMCCCCAFSIAEELLHKDLIKSLQIKGEDEPFLFVMASASQMMQGSGGNLPASAGSGSGGRPGIGQDNRLAEGDYDISDGVSDKRVTLNNHQRVIIQKVIKDGEGLKAGDDRKDSKKDSKKDDEKDDKKDRKDDKKDSGKDTKKGDKKSGNSEVTPIGKDKPPPQAPAAAAAGAGAGAAGIAIPPPTGAVKK